MKATLYARKCSITGKGTNACWVLPEHGLYIASKSDCKKWLRKHWKMSIKEAFDYSEENGANLFYWTSWEDVQDYQYIKIDGELHEISEYFNL